MQAGHTTGKKPETYIKSLKGMYCYHNLLRTVKP